MTNNAPKLSENAVTLFRMYVEDAGNWSGQPLVGGNVELLGAKEDRGLLTHLKRAGLIRTTETRDRINCAIQRNSWVEFTPAGVEFARSLGYSARDLWAGGLVDGDEPAQESK